MQLRTISTYDLENMFWTPPPSRISPQTPGNQSARSQLQHDQLRLVCPFKLKEEEPLGFHRTEVLLTALSDVCELV